MKRTSKALSLFLAVLFAAASLIGTVSAAQSDRLDGEASRVYRAIADGADFSGYVLRHESGGVREFSAVTFDCARNDLCLDVAGTNDSSLSRAVADHVRENGRRVVAALGAGSAPGGYTVVGSEIVCASGTSAAFGVTSEGAALVGEITFCAKIKDRRTGTVITADSVNTASDGAAAIYTDSYGCSLPADAALIALDVGYDQILTPGVPIEGNVAAIALSGPEQIKTAQDRIVIAVPRKDAEALADFEPGDRVTVTPDVDDALGNTAIWRTVKTAVPGTAILVNGGAAADGLSTEREAASVIGIRPDGRAMMLASYGGSGRSLGFAGDELAELCVNTGMTDAVLLCTGGAVGMLASDDDNVLRATGRSSAGEAAGISLVLSVPDETTRVEIGEYEADIFLFANDAGHTIRILEESERHSPEKPKFTAPNTANDNAPGASAAAQPSGFAAEAGDLYIPINSLYKQLEFDSTGEWLTLVIKKSDLEAWYGKIFRDLNVI